MRLRANTLRVGFVAIILLAGSLVLYTMFNADLKNTTKNDIERQQKQLATTAVNAVEQYLYDMQKRMETIALNPMVRDAQRSEACNQHLQENVEVNSQELNNLGRVSKDGVFICAVNRTIIGEPVSKYGNYFETIAKDPEHKPAMSRLIVPSGSASAVVAIHVPVLDANGTFNGTIGGAIYFDELQKKLVADARISQNSAIALYDNNLDILYSPDPLIRNKNLDRPEVKQLYTPENVFKQFKEKVKQGSTEGVLEYNVRDELQHVVYKSVQAVDRDWTVAVTVPAKDMEAFVSHTTARTLFITINALFIIAAVGFAWVLLRLKIYSLDRKK